MIILNLHFIEAPKQKHISVKQNVININCVQCIILDQSKHVCYLSDICFLGTV